MICQFFASSGVSVWVGRLVAVIAVMLLVSPVWGQDGAEPDRSIAEADLHQLVSRSVAAIVHAQEDDGAWPYEGVYRVSGEIPVGYRIGGTAIVCQALLYAAAKDDAAVNEAIEKGLSLILAELENPLMETSVEDRYDVRVWGHIYALELFCRLKHSERFAEFHDEFDAWIGKLTQSLLTEELDGGGWNYASRRRHASFVTAPAVQALLWAKSVGADVPDEVLQRSVDILISSRTDDGAFQYSGTVARRGGDPLPGSIARSAICESTLTLLGRRDDGRLQAAIDAFHTHWDELEKRRKQTGTHAPPYSVAPYYFYYGHRYLAQAIQLLPAAKQQQEWQRFVPVLLKTRDADDTWNDRVFERSKSYGTAMSVLALVNSGCPLPPTVAIDGSGGR